MFLNCETAVSTRFLERLGLVSVFKVERLVSPQSWEFEKMERLGLISVLRLNVLWTPLGVCHTVDNNNRVN